jgi:hypothetical protein
MDIAHDEPPGGWLVYSMRASFREANYDFPDLGRLSGSRARSFHFARIPEMPFVVNRD